VTKLPQLQGNRLFVNLKKSRNIMKKIIFLLLAVNIFLKVSAQSADELAVKTVLANQVSAWNKGSIDEFMKTYWNNDSLMFVGHGGLTYGYLNTLNNYKKNYNDSAKMGKLFFTLLKMKKLSPEYYFVVGRWFLKRGAGDIGGIYTLLLRKIKNKWVIIVDHTS
jgi:ketosteroid isomerase-like protein